MENKEQNTYDTVYRPKSIDKTRARINRIWQNGFGQKNVISTKFIQFSISEYKTENLMFIPMIKIITTFSNA